MARIFITGASSGLGMLTATALIEAEHEVIVHARKPARLEGEEMLSLAHGVAYGDLSDLEETRHVAEMADKFGPFDAVIHNAGLDHGPELVPVNVVAPFVLSALMQRPKRVVVMSSSLHRSASEAHLEAKMSGQREVRYRDTKLYVTAFTMWLARQWPDSLVNALCPGWVPTRMGGPDAPDDLTEGHRTQEWLATAPETEISPRTGSYWHHLAVEQPHPAVLDTHFQGRVIAALEARTGLSIPV